jgi:hypothetical protein
VKQATLFDEPARTVELCGRCRCCDAVDGRCLGECNMNGHRRRARGIQPAPAAGGWVDLETGFDPYPGANEEQ